MLFWVHDSAAALVKDGFLVASAEEERFTRVRHQRGYPKLSVEYCLKEGKLRASDVDIVAIAYNPYKALFSPSIYLHPVLLARHFANLLMFVYFERELRRLFPKARLEYVNHHAAHAASTFYPSGFSQANILVVDGAGETETFSFFEGNGKEIKKIWDIPLARFGGRKNANSIGLVYSRVTNFLNLGTHGEGKTMGLASYGRPTFDFSKILSIKKHDDFFVERGNVEKFYPHLARGKDDPITEEHKNLAASLQHSLEESIVNLAREAFDKTGIKKFCMAGGVALNCNTNSRISQESFCDGIFVQPASNDSGVALGAALFAAARVEKELSFPPQIAYLGPSFGDAEIEKLLKESNLSYEHSENIEKTAARLLAEGNIIGWFQGRMEIGPRALCNRSVLADPSVPGMNDRVNGVKHREIWRPFAPVTTLEDGGKFFEDFKESPFMLLTYFVKKEWRSKLPAITHIDGSSRIQTVTKIQNERAYKLLREFEAIKGFPVLLNTSFNDAGEPIICTPKDAVRCFMSTPMDALCLGNFVLRKKK